MLMLALSCRQWALPEKLLGQRAGCGRRELLGHIEPAIMNPQGR